METRNVLLAVILSTIVLIFWATFFEAPIVEQKPAEKQITKSENSSTPSIEEIEAAKTTSRKEDISKILVIYAFTGIIIFCSINWFSDYIHNFV